MLRPVPKLPGMPCLPGPCQKCPVFGAVVNSRLFMFCPVCRSEYRTGFTRCSDCDVNLVSELPEPQAGVKYRRLRGSWVETLRSHTNPTLREWVTYKRKTGKLPWLSIAIHCLFWVVLWSGILFLVVFCVSHHWSQWQFTGIVVLVGAPYIVFWACVERKVKLREIRSRRRLENGHP